MTIPAPSPWNLLARFSLFALGYLALVVVGYALSQPTAPFATFWPPLGLFVGVLLRNRMRYWLGFVAGAILAQLVHATLLTNELGPVAPASCAGTNLAALLSAWTIRKLLGQFPTLHSMREVLLFALAATLACAFGAVLVAATARLSGGQSSFGVLWRVLWSRDTGSVLAFAPLVLVWPNDALARLRSCRPVQFLEVAGLFVGVPLVLVGLASTRENFLTAVLLLPALLFVTVRFGAVGLACAIALVVVAVNANLTWNRGLFALLPLGPEQKLVLLHSFLAVSCLTFWVLLAILHQRDRVEQQLRASEERLRLLFDFTPQPMWIFDRKTLAFLEVNRAAVLQYGYDRAEFDKMTIEDIRPADEIPRLRASLARIASGQSPLPGPWKHQRKDGSPIEVELFFQQLEYDGRPAEVVIAHDISARKQAEQALAKANAFRETIIRSAGEGICACSTIEEFPHIRFSVWNEQMTAITGYTMEEINRLGWYQSLYPDPRVQQRAIDRMARMRHGDDLRSEEWTIARKDGLRRIVAITTSLVELEGTGAVVALLQDITLRKQAEHALHQREQELTDFIENAAVGMHWIDGEGIILWANRTEFDLVGFERDEYLGRPIREFHVDPEVIDKVLGRLKRKEVVENYEARLRCKDGSVKQVQITSNVLWEGDRFVHTRCFTRDITERKRAEQSVQRRLTELTLLNQIGVICSAARSEDELFTRTTHLLANRLFPDNCGFVLLDSERQVLVPHPSFVLTNPAAQSADIPLETGIIGQVIRTGKTMRIADVSRESSYLATDSRTCSELCVPLEVAGQVVGAFNTESPRRDAYSDVEEQLVGTIVEVVGNTLERLRVEASRQQSEERFARFMRHLPGLAWIKDHDGRYVFVNESASAAFRRPIDEILGRTDEELFPPATATAFRQQDRLAVTHESGVQVVESLEHEDGVHHSLVHKFPIPGLEGRQAFSAGIAIDITERRRAEETLRAREEQLQLLLQGVHDVVWSVPLWGEVLQATPNFVSHQARAILGYSPEEFLTDNAIWWQNIHPDDQQLVADTTQRLLAAPGTVTRMYRFRHRRTGQYRWLEDRVVSQTDESGQVVALFGVARDITERQLAQEALAEREATIRAILDTTADPIITIDESGVVESFNPAAEKLFGYPVNETLGQKINLLMPSPFREEHDGYLARYRNTGERRIIGLGREVIGRRKDGSVFPMELNVSELRLGERRLFVGVVRDLTKGKQVEQTLADQARTSAFRGDIGRLLTERGSMREVLQRCAALVAWYLEAAFVRIWTLNEVENVLLLQASAREDAHVDGPHGRIPVGQDKIGQIAQERKAHLTNAVIGDPRIRDQEWARRERLVSFAGFPLLVEERVVGVLALFARHELPVETLQSLTWIVDTIAQFIERKRSEQQLLASLHEKEALLKEIHHRVKNNLQIVSSLLSLQASKIKDSGILDVLRESQNRVRSMALVHEGLYRSQSLAFIQMAQHLEQLCVQLYRSYGIDSSRIALELHLSPLALDLDRAIPCGLILSELVSNALKHAFPNNRHGRIIVTLGREPNAQYTLQVADDGVGLPADLDWQQTESLGLSLVADLTDQLEGTLVVRRGPGTTFGITFAGGSG